MDLDSGNLMISLLTGAIGYALFMFGKKQRRLPQLVGGIALMIYPWFVVSVGWMAIVGAAIIAGTVGAVRAGW